MYFDTTSGYHPHVKSGCICLKAVDFLAGEPLTRCVMFMICAVPTKTDAKSILLERADWTCRWRIKLCGRGSVKICDHCVQSRHQSLFRDGLFSQQFSQFEGLSVVAESVPFCSFVGKRKLYACDLMLISTRVHFLYQMKDTFYAKSPCIFEPHIH